MKIILSAAYKEYKYKILILSTLLVICEILIMYALYNSKEILIYLTENKMGLLIIILLIVSIMKLYLYKKQFELIYIGSATLTKKIIQKYSIGDREGFLSNGQDGLINVNTKNMIVLQKILSPIVQSIISIIISMTLGIMLLYFYLEEALLIGMIVFFIYFLVNLYQRKYLKENSKMLHEAENAKNNSLVEIYKNYIESKTYNTESKFLKKYTDKDMRFKIINAQNDYFAVFPRYIFEAIIVLILITAMIINREGVNVEYEMLALFGYVGQKILPNIQIINNAYVNYLGNKDFVNELEQILTLEIIEISNWNYEESEELKKQIVFNNIKVNGFKNELKYNFSIEKEVITLLNGKSGSGKSTLFNVICNLKSIDAGEIIADHEMKIAYVPQVASLYNDTLYNNILMNNVLDEKDVAKIFDVCQIDFIRNDEIINVENNNISGGQLQRIAIARALCCKPDLLLLDESLSGFEESCKINIIKFIKTLKITTLLTTHDEELKKLIENKINL